MLEQALLIRLSETAPMPDLTENELIQDIITDVMRGAEIPLFSVLPVCSAVVKANGFIPRNMRVVTQAASAVSAFQQSGKDLGFRDLHFPPPMFDLLLNPLEVFLRYKGFMGILHTEPEFLRSMDLFLVFVGNRRLLTVNRIPDVHLVVQDAFNL